MPKIDESAILRNVGDDDQPDNTDIEDGDGKGGSGSPGHGR